MSSDYGDEEFDSPTSATSPPSWLRPLNKKKPESREGRPAASASPPAPEEPTPKKEVSPKHSRRYSYTPSHSRSSSQYSSAKSSPRFVARSPTPRSEASDDRYSEPASKPVVPPKKQWAAQAPPPPAVEANPATEIAALRKKNQELQLAVDSVREQLAKIAPKLSMNIKRKHSAETERMNRLQTEALQLQQEHAGLVKKLRDVEHVKELEKQLATREAEVKALQERNKFLHSEVRTNAKKLKQQATIEEQRAQQLAVMKQERKVAMQALEKAQKEAEHAAISKESSAKRLKQLEAKDRLPELKTEDVKQLIDMKAQLAQKQETIESLQYRLSVLKRAHESVNRTLVAHPADDADLDALRNEVAGLRAKLAQAGVTPNAEPTPMMFPPKAAPPPSAPVSAAASSAAPKSRKESTATAASSAPKSRKDSSASSAAEPKPSSAAEPTEAPPPPKPAREPTPEEKPKPAPLKPAEVAAPASRQRTEPKPAPPSREKTPERPPPPAASAPSPGGESVAYTEFSEEAVDEDVAGDTAGATSDTRSERPATPPKASAEAIPPAPAPAPAPATPPDSKPEKKDGDTPDWLQDDD